MFGVLHIDSGDLLIYTSGMVKKVEKTRTKVSGRIIAVRVIAVLALIATLVVGVISAISVNDLKSSDDAVRACAQVGDEDVKLSCNSSVTYLDQIKYLSYLLLATFSFVSATMFLVVFLSGGTRAE